MFGGTLLVPAWLEAEVETPERPLPGTSPAVPPTPAARDDEEAADDEEDPIGLDGDNDGVGSGHDGRRIDDDELEFGAQLGDGVGEFMGGEQIGRIGGERSGGNGGEIRNSRMRNSDEIEAGSSGEIRTEPGISVAGETENASDARLAEVGIDEDGAVAQLGESDGEIGGSRGFAFAGKGAGDEDDLGRVIGLRKQDGCA